MPACFFQGAGEAGAREKLRWIAVVCRGGLGYDLLKGDGELVRAERAAFADFLAERYDFIPRVEGHSVSLFDRVSARWFNLSSPATPSSLPSR